MLELLLEDRAHLGQSHWQVSASSAVLSPSGCTRSSCSHLHRSLTSCRPSTLWNAMEAIPDVFGSKDLT